MHTSRASVAIPTIASPPARLQSSSFRVSCTAQGTNWNEPIADREGRTLQTDDSACVVQGGPIDGAVATLQALWVYDMGVGTLVSSQSVFRTPGAVLVVVARSGRLIPQMTEGRVTGWDAAGTSSIAMATGTAAGLEKKNVKWTAWPTGAHTYVIEARLE